MKKNFINVSLGSFLAFVAMGVIISACSDETVKPETIIQEQGAAREAELAALRAIKQDSLNFLRYLDSAAYAQEVDSLRRIDSLSRAQDSVALVTGGGYLTYNVQILNMSTAAGAFTRVSEESAVSGAVVTVSMFGVTMSATTDASGIAVFPGMVQGNISGSAVVADHTDANWVAELDVEDEWLFVVSSGAVEQVVISDGTGSETIVDGPAQDEFPVNDESGDETDFLVLPNGELVSDPGQPISLNSAIPVFATTSNLSNITGYVWAETDLTNTSREPAPMGTTVQAYIDVEGLVDMDWFDFEDDFEYDNSDHSWYAHLQYISYDDALYSTTVDSTGQYSLMVPAAIQGLPIALKCPNFRADQTYWDWNTAATASKVFGFEIEPDPTNGVEQYVVMEINSAGSGFNTSGVTVNDDGSGQVWGIQLLTMGSDYNCDTIPLSFGGTSAGYALNDGTGMIGSVVLTDSGTGVTGGGPFTVSEFGVQATATIGLNNFIIPPDNGVVAVVVTASGKGYDSATAAGTGPYVTFAGLVAGVDNLSGTRAQGTAMLNAQHGVEMINVTTKGGGYANAPGVTITCGDVSNYSVDVTVLDPNVNALATVYVSDDTVTGAGASSLAIPLVVKIDSIHIRAAGNNQGDGYTTAPLIDFGQLGFIDVGGTNTNIDYSGGVSGDTAATASATVGTLGFFGQLSVIDTIIVVTDGFYLNSSGADVGADNMAGTVGSFTITDAGANPAIVSGQVTAITVTGGGDLFCGQPLLDTAGLGGVGGPAQKLVVGSFGMCNGCGSQTGADTIQTIPIVQSGAGYVAGDEGNLAAQILADLSNLGSGAAGTAIIEGVQIVGVGITDKGADYLCDPLVVFDAPSMNMAGVAQAATGTPKMFNGQVIGVTITDPGFGYQASDFDGIGTDVGVDFVSGTGATGESWWSGFGFKSIAYDATTYPTSGYCDPSTVTISASKGSGATADVIVMDGMILGFTVTNSGSGYLSTSASIDILGDGVSDTQIPPPAGVDGFEDIGARLRATVVNGVVTAVDVLEKGGSHFDPTCPPILTVRESIFADDFHANAVKRGDFTVFIDALGEIDSVAVDYGGENYPNQNWPIFGESAWVGGEIVEFDKAVIAMPNMDRHVDFYLGTGASTSNDNTSGE